MTDTERSRAIAMILAECPNLFSDFQVIQTTHRLNYTYSGPDGVGRALLDALDEARVQAKEAGR